MGLLYRGRTWWAGVFDCEDGLAGAEESRLPEPGSFGKKMRGKGYLEVYLTGSHQIPSKSKCLSEDVARQGVAPGSIGGGWGKEAPKSVIQVSQWHRTAQFTL